MQALLSKLSLLLVTLRVFASPLPPLPPLPLPLLCLDLLGTRFVLAARARRIFVHGVAHRHGELTRLVLIFGPQLPTLVRTERPVHGFGLAAIHAKVARGPLDDVDHLKAVGTAVLLLAAVLADDGRDQVASHTIHGNAEHVLLPFKLRARWRRSTHLRAPVPV